METTKRVAATTSNLAVRFSSAVTHAKHHTYHRHTTTTTNITPPPAMTMACGSGTRILPRPVYLVTAPRRWHRPRRRSRGGERRGRMCRRSRMMMMMMTMVMMERDMTRTSTTGTVRRGSFAAGGGEPGGGDGPGRGRVARRVADLDLDVGRLSDAAHLARRRRRRGRRGRDDEAVGLGAAVEAEDRFLARSLRVQPRLVAVRAVARALPVLAGEQVHRMVLRRRLGRAAALERVPDVAQPRRPVAEELEQRRQGRDAAEDDLRLGSGPAPVGSLAGWERGGDWAVPRRSSRSRPTAPAWSSCRSWR